MRRRHELPFGAEPGPQGVRFRLWAPRTGAVEVALEGAGTAETLPMRSEGEGWFALTTPRARPGARYRYVVDGAAFPDPASRFQPEGVHGASEVVDPGAYPWGDAGWRGRAWEEIVIYELHLGTFSPSGDFAGAIAHLDHLCRLGVTAVELMPIAAFPGRRNWGYDGVQLFAPAAAYGRPEELKALVGACHARGLAILLDVVYNHFGPEGNYLTTIAPDFFTRRHHTPWGAAIDFDGANSRPVRDFFVHNALYWLEEYHFDGLRFDAVHAIADESDPDIVSEIAQKVRRRFRDREIHLILENDRNEAHRLVRSDGRATLCSAQWNDDLHHALHVLLTGESRGYYADYADRPAAHLGRALAEGFDFQGEASPYRGARARGEPSAGLPATAFVGFLQNHDQVGNTPFGTRIAARAPEAALHAAVAIVLLAPQIPLLFMGEEWASARPFAFFCQFAPPLDDAVREGRAREFAQYPEFADTAAPHRLPDPGAAATFAMSRLDWSEPGAAPHAAWLERYRRLLALRAAEIVPRLKGMRPGGTHQLVGAAALCVEWRLGDGSRLRLLANFAAEPVPLAGPADKGRLLYCSAAAPPTDSIAPLSAAFFLQAASAPG